MKKVSLFIISILLFALILSSCNLDAQEGIFSQIASSQKDAGIKVMAYLGKTTNCHYVQTNSSIISINTSKEVTTVASSTSDAKIRDACLTTSGDLYVLTTIDGSTDTKLVKYENATGEDASTTLVESPKHLLINGAYVFVENEGEDTETYKIDFLNGSGVEEDLTSAPITILENGDYVFVKCSSTTNSITTYTYLVYKKDGTEKLKKEGITTNTEIRGFQPLSDTSYLLVDDSGNIYSMTSSGSSDITDTNTDLTSSSLPNGQVYSFSYEDAQDSSKTYVVYKTTSYFERLTITTTDGTPSYEVATYNTNGYSTDLRTSTVTNIVPSDDNGKFVIATWTNSVFEVNTSNDSYENLLN